MYNPTWLTIPAGIFTMGSNPRAAAPPFANERPRQRIQLSEFCISRVPITNAQYHRFVMACQHPAPGHWPEGRLPAGSEDFPVTYISWHDAQAFCAWAGVRLPTEAEWEKAARGDDGRWWPWGDTLPDATRCHFNGQAQGIAPAAQSVLPVGQFPQGASPYGVLDMAGNVWEWTNSPYRAYPYRAEDGSEVMTPGGVRVVRGGSYNHDLRQIRCAARDGMAAGVRDVYIGFRVVAGAGACNHASPLDLDWVTIAAGAFWLGSEPGARPSAILPSELPQHQLALAEFCIAQTPVTNAAYADFVQATGHPAPTHWLTCNTPTNLADHPVTHVDWYDAQAFCRWAGVRLPTEAEWEKAARGSALAEGELRIYPWGNAPPDRTRLNYRHSGKRTTTTPVNRYPRGASPYGVLDMAGNVWEWVSSAYGSYPYSATDGREDVTTAQQRVLRGGSFASPGAAYVRCAMRSLSYPTRRREHIGFRVVQS
jgi:formylglycine-generating enzyme required for sulfatase activity